jgi:hypothetical protein
LLSNAGLVGFDRSLDQNAQPEEALAGAALVVELTVSVALGINERGADEST